MLSKYWPWILLFIIPSVWPLSGELQFLQSGKVHVGDILQAKLRLESSTFEDDSPFYQMEGHFLTEALYIVSVDRVEKSPGPPEGWEIFLTIALRKALNTEQTHTFPLQNLDIPLLLPRVNIVDQQLEIQEFKKWNQKGVPQSSKMIYWSVMAVILLIVIMVMAFYFTRRGKKGERDEGEDRAKIKDLVKKASTRKSLEEIYQYRAILKQVYNQREVNDFLKKLNECQYKPVWTEEEEMAVKKKLSLLREES